jgi:hypothetical protein
MRLCWLCSGTRVLPRWKMCRRALTDVFGLETGVVDLALKISFLSPSHNGIFFLLGLLFSKQSRAHHFHFSSTSLFLSRPFNPASRLLVPG